MIFLRKTLHLITRISALVFLMFGLVGCDKSQDLQIWLQNTYSLKATARVQSAIIPYRTVQHQALKEYFTALTTKALELKSKPKYAAQFNLVLSKSDLSQLCEKVFLPKEEWRVIIQHCTRNRFFLCSEEVRAYPQAVSSLRELLTDTLKQRFDETAACQVVE